MHPSLPCAYIFAKRLDEKKHNPTDSLLALYYLRRNWPQLTIDDFCTVLDEKRTMDNREIPVSTLQMYIRYGNYADFLLENEFLYAHLPVSKEQYRLLGGYSVNDITIFSDNVWSEK